MPQEFEGDLAGAVFWGADMKGATFRDVDLTALQALAGRFVSRLYQPGQDIYAQGDAGDRFYIVVRGTVSISTLDAVQQAIRLADLQDGDYFGEVEMVNKGRRTTTVKAHTPNSAGHSQRREVPTAVNVPAPLPT